jgi:hypothetical protein
MVGEKEKLCQNEFVRRKSRVSCTLNLMVTTDGYKSQDKTRQAGRQASNQSITTSTRSFLTRLHYSGRPHSPLVSEGLPLPFQTDSQFVRE